ncbi:5'-3' exonuclease H3TH domain-containing protein [Iamia majanohamensis]|uniref:5'-3' exonuclease n=1 Tax=Iamia majanohamensis TaxID=467976 RepID=A0AAF0BW31_9ACTN|nr:5'-3' exonuclease H3TH domain-containing protein [Iamia majanohamensis]WCO67375.1 5'-3' exonuclease H3TH domain-containing protein [Iamia majanohamensis]
MSIEVHLVDGTYELFRHFFAVPSHVTEDGREVGAVRGTAGSVLRMLEEGATHVAVATDHVIESFRNDLYGPYKDGSGVDPALLSQFTLLEEVLEALGVTVTAMVEHEADDALAALAAVAAADDRVDKVWICTPDKDLAQCVGGKVAQLDRRKGVVVDAAGVEEKYGVPPESIPDWLGLVGDSADGFPGLPGWGAKSAAAVLRAFGHIDAIPADPAAWHVKVRSAAALADTLAENMADALLFRRLATLEVDAPVPGDVDALRWRGPAEGAEALCASIDADGLARRAAALAEARA